MTKIFNQKHQTKLRRKLRRDMPKGEQLLWMHLRNGQLGYKFRRQVGVGPFVADFYSPRLRLAVEVDGITHQNDMAVERDKHRDRYFHKLDITTKRYTAHEVWENLEFVKQDIYNTCVRLSMGGKPPPAPPS